MSSPAAYYNEHDPKAAAWLRALIADGHIAPGEVDERDIRDVRPAELVRFTQCHFFAGIGVWGYAARRAGWPDSRPLWSASLPCQPWSDAGAGKGFEDDRHLWPTFEALRLALRPFVAVGEQVASKDGLAWLDAVQADVEASGDAFGAVDLCSAGFGAPHIRQRLHWVAYAQGSGSGAGLRDSGSPGERGNLATDSGPVRSMANASSGGCRELGDVLVAGRGGHADSGRLADDACSACGGSGRRGPFFPGGMSTRCENCRVAEPDVQGRGEQPQRNSGPARGGDLPSGADADGRSGILRGTGGLDDANGRPVPIEIREPQGGDGQRPDSPNSAPGHNGGPGPTNGIWRAADWLACRDGKWRPVEPGTFPLAHGAPARVGRLRGYGNAINAEVATAFIEAVMDILDSERPTA